MRTIEVFESALCCSTGVCGPEVPQELVTFSADLDWLRTQGVDAARYNLASEPSAFAGRQAVLDFLQISGSERLPLVLVNGTVVLTGRYPNRAELVRWSGTSTPERSRPALPMAGATDGCCGGGSC